jgi:V/A-type H+-transporting ATPase subunit K
MEWAFLGQIGLALAFGLAAMGSSLGIIAAGKAAAGAWAKEAKAGMALRFNYIIFVGAPISQTFYAMIVMHEMAKVLEHASSSAGLMLGIGLATGISEMVSAWGQGMIGAAACRCLSEGEGKGLAFLLIAIGIIEAVGIFTMVFMLMLTGSIAG